MQIVFLIKPYSINMYSYKDDLYELLGSEDISYIDKESHSDYENRAIYVCKDICQDFVNTDLYKENKKNIASIKVILTNPWCIYEIMNLEKKLDKQEKIDQKFIDRLIVHKETEGVTLLKNNIFNISLNGYSVQKVEGQSADHVHVQYLSIYSSVNFIEKLRNTLETIFHLHKIEIDSIYSHINDNHRDDTTNNQLKIIIEDQGIDLSYVYQGKNISTLFIPCGYLSIKNKIREILHIDDITLDKILRSKSLNLSSDKLSFTYDKNLNNIWPDLDKDVKQKIDDQINISLDFIKLQIRNFVENVENEFIKKDININVYCIDESILFNIGFILAFAIKNDAYILGKLLTNESNIFTKKVF